MVFSPDDWLIATASYDGTARIRDRATGDCLHILAGHTERVFGVAFSPAGHLLATASEDGTARVWDPFTGDCLIILSDLRMVHRVAFSPDGRLFATVGGMACVWHSPKPVSTGFLW